LKHREKKKKIDREKKRAIYHGTSSLAFEWLCSVCPFSLDLFLFFFFYTACAQSGHYSLPATNSTSITHLAMRQLSHHEQKLLKKVDFLQWKSTENVREVKVMRRYHIQKREDYIK
jgi:hypothetical protein